MCIVLPRGCGTCYTTNMSPELIGIISVGAGLAVLFVGLFAWLRQDMKAQGQEIKEQGQEIKEQGQELRGEMTGLGDEVTAVKIEVAALKATVETYFRVRVDPPRGGPDNQVDRAA